MESLREDQCRILKRYEDYKAANKLLDFDDLLHLGWKVLMTSSYVRELVQCRFKFVFVDEFQDLCPVEHAIVKIIAAPENNLIAVGDPCQNIFSFRGSDSSIISNFGKEYSNALIADLTTNYRSSASIVGLSDRILNSIGVCRASIVVRDSKILPKFIAADDALDEARIIADMINVMIEDKRVLPKDICILIRASTSNQFISEELATRNIPFTNFSSSKTLYEDPVVTPLVSYLKLSMDSNEESALTGMLGTLYLNKASVAAWLKSNIQNDKSLFENLLFMPKLQDYHFEIITRRECLINDIKELAPTAAVQKLRSDFYDKFLKIEDRSKLTITQESYVDILAGLEESAGRFSTIPEFIDHIELLTAKRRESSQREIDAETVSLMSIHRSKGLQFPVVFIASAIENVIPHKRALAEASFTIDSSGVSQLDEVLKEECRLLYVASTRAEDELYISIPRQSYNSPAVASRFLRDAFSIR